MQDDETREAALALVRPVLDYVNLAATYAADLYVEVEQLAFADLERVRRDLGRDLRRLTDVLDLVIAARLAQPRPEPQGEARPT